MKKLELTSPAGGWDQLVAAVNAGADSVYLGYERFGARAYADNFDLKQLKKAVSFAHSSNVKVYLTLNTLIKDDEIEDIILFLEEYISLCNDGVIIQDFGLYKILADLFKDTPVHASTQLNTHNPYSVKFLKKLKFKRTVLAREMALEEIIELKKMDLMEIEVFGHGSQCYSYSGNCYFSSFIGGRSGNRGRCAQPCRMKYRLMEKNDKGSAFISGKDSFLLSKNDLWAINLIPRLVKAGIDALKIEGRMKSPEYVGIVTRIYRKYIDRYYEDRSGYRVDPKDLYKLKQIFSRNLGTGYLEDRYPQDIVSLKKSGSIGNFMGRVYKIDHEKAGGKKPGRTGDIYIKSDGLINKGDILEVWTKKGNRRLVVDQFEEIKKSSKKNLYRLSVEGASEILLKDRVFKYFDKNMDEEAASLYKYNKIKKTALSEKSREALENIPDKINIRKYLESYFFIPGGKKGERHPDGSLGITVNAVKRQQIKIAVEEEADHIVLGNFSDILDESFFSSDEYGWLLKKYSRPGCPKISINIPAVIYKDDLAFLKSSLQRSIKHGITSFRISNTGVLELLKEISKKEGIGIEIYLGHSLNLFNTSSVNLFNEYCSDQVLLKGLEFSPELNLEEISQIISRIYAKFSFRPEISIFGYGFFPVMHARYKIDHLINGYNQGSKYYLEDMKGYSFRIDGDHKGDIVIFNSKKICTLFDLDKILQAMITNVTIDGRFQNDRELRKVIKTYRESLNTLKSKGTDSYHRFTASLQEDSLFKDYSKGHIFRGVK